MHLLIDVCVYTLEAMIVILSIIAKFFYINIYISRMKNVFVKAHELGLESMNLFDAGLHGWQWSHRRRI